MKSASAPILAILYAGNEYDVADLYELVLASGTYRWTSGAVDVSWGGNTYSAAPGGPGLERGRSRSTAGLDVATMDVKVVPGAVTVAGVPVLLAAVRGAFDLASLTITRVFYDTSPAIIIIGSEVVFAGNVVEVKPGSTELDLTIRSSLALIDVQLPKRFVQTTCPYTVYDANTCKVNPAGYTVTKTLDVGSTKSVLVTTTTTGLLTPGAILTFTSGSLSGTKCQAASVSGGSVIQLTSPLLALPAAGDTISIVRGCNKARDLTTGDRQGDCAAYFSNLLRFGGFPDTPKATQ